jgi:membrane-bound lytic murein transglycosylase D
MEKRLQMKLWLCIAPVLLWLSGCASLAPAPGAESTPTTAEPTKTLATQAATTSGLSPLSAGQPHQSPIAHLSLPHDLWERIRRGFAMPDLQTDLVEDRVQWYAARPEYLTRMTERSSKYLYHIVEELERRQMPTELALLPFIESAFNPQAVSSAKATGMWQFMPRTGKDFDLKQNVFRDDRRDVLASTRAALDYLQKLYGMFGDWHLALAAYNWGEGNVGKAIARNQRNGLGGAYTDLSMPMETRFYVPKLQAIKNLVARPGNYNVTLPLIHNHPYFQSVPLPRDMDVAVAAKLANISLEDFKSLNPSANRPVLLAAGTPQILLPWDNAETFQQSYEAFAGGQLATWTAWVAPTTLKVADAARRAGLSEEELRRVNNIPPRMLIKAGSALLVPRSARMDEDVDSDVADNGRLDLAPEVVLRRVVVKAGKKDTLATLAQQYKVSEAQIIEWNDLRANARLQPGQAVTLMLSGSNQASSKKGGKVKSAKAGSPKPQTTAKAKSGAQTASSTRVAKR